MTCHLNSSSVTLGSFRQDHDAAQILWLCFTQLSHLRLHFATAFVQSVLTWQGDT